MDCAVNRFPLQHFQASSEQQLCRRTFLIHGKNSALRGCENRMRLAAGWLV
jgi:hypothetical protein